MGWEWVLLGAPGLGLLVGGWPGARLGAQGVLGGGARGRAWAAASCVTGQGCRESVAWPRASNCGLRATHDPGGIGGWRVPTRKHRGHTTHPNPGLLAAHCWAWGPVPLGWPRQVSGVGVTGWSSIGATAGMPQPRPAEVLLPPGGPGQQLHARWPAASDRTPAGLSRILGRGVTTGRSWRPVWGHETAECVFGWPCLVWTGCWLGPSSQKSCSSGAALCS